MSEVTPKNDDLLEILLHDVKYEYIADIENAYFAKGISTKGKEKTYEELKKSYTDAGGDLAQLHDKNGDVKGGVKFYKVKTGGHKGDLEHIAKNYMTGGVGSKTKNLKRLENMGYTHKLTKDQVILFEMKEPDPVITYEKINNASLSQVVYLVVESKKEMCMEVEVEIIEDGTFMNDEKNTPLSFMQLTTSADGSVTKEEKTLFKVKLEGPGQNGLNQGAIQLELAPKDEEKLKKIKENLIPDEPEKVPEVTIDKTPIDTSKAYTKTGSEKEGFTYTINKEYCKAQKLGYSIGTVGKASKLVNLNISELGKMNSLRQTDKGLYWPHTGEPIFYHESNVTANYKKALAKREADIKVAKSKVKEKTTNIFIRGKSGESIVKSKLLVSGNKACEITKDQFIKIFPSGTDEYWHAINKTMCQFDINTFLRKSHFLAQVSHETAKLKYKEEVASGSIYEGREDLGNTTTGDGKRFKGRGLLQLTGRTNYESFQKYARDNFSELSSLDITSSTIKAKEVATNTTLNALASGWYWKYKRPKLNKMADQDDLFWVSVYINGAQVQSDYFYSEVKLKNKKDEQLEPNHLKERNSELTRVKGILK